jgi:Zn-dependent protease with chaperone function
LIAKVARWLWPIAFLFPLRLVANRYCWFPFIDPIYHAMLALHEHLPFLIVVAIVAAIVAGTAHVAAARARIAAVLAFAVPTPDDIAEIFADEAQRLRLKVPPIAYLAVNQRLCFALAGRQPTIVLSRGFLAGLSPEDIRLMARHELLHVRFHDPLRRLIWHLAFTAFLFPAFDELERWLTIRRERRVNLLAGEEEPERYARLLTHCTYQEHTLCSNTGESVQHKSALRLVTAPLIVGSLLLGLFASHAAFMQQLAYLTHHHC